MFQNYSANRSRLVNHTLLLLNREPFDVQHLRFLVDGSHWNRQKRLKKPYTNGGGGHLSCFSSFNFIIYKESLGRERGHAFNSQCREQCHALLDKCTASLRQKSYPNFMQWLACRNFINMGEL